MLKLSTESTQHRERIVLVGFRRDLNIHGALPCAMSSFYPVQRPSFGRKLLGQWLTANIYTDAETLEYLYNYAKKAQLKCGFGFGLVNLKIKSIACTLSARYHKDGSEILIFAVRPWLG